MPYSKLTTVNFHKGIIRMTHGRPLCGFTIYDPGFPRKTPDSSTPARAAAIALENSIRGNPYETGAFFNANGSLIIRKVGMPDRVNFSPTDLTNTGGTLFTHNHPTDMTFSVADVRNAVEQRLVEVRVVCPRIRHIMQPAPTWPNWNSIDAAIRSIAGHVLNDVHGRITNGQLSRRDANFEISHLIWERVAHKLGFEYIREAS